MNICIIEDEELTARKLQRLLTEVESSANVVAILGSVEESVDWLDSNPTPDLILMDIELADGQSFEIFNRVPVNAPVVFTTAYDEYAIKAFKVNSIDYLLKPLKEEDLRRALDKLRTMKQLLGGQETNSSTLQASIVNVLKQLNVTATEPKPRAEYRDRFLIKQGQRLFPVSANEVAYFVSRNKMSFLKTRQGHEWLVEQTMDELEGSLDPRRFFRLNRQIIAELDSVDKVHLYFNGKLKVQLRPACDDEVLVSREKAGDFKTWLGE